MKTFILFILSLFVVTNVQAAPQWWQQIYTSNSNNQVTLKDDNNANLSAIQNPTAANVQTNVNTSTQPPTVIVQATATLPIVAIGAACVSGTNTAGLSSADNITLLTCGAGNTWQITNRVALQTAVSGNVCNITTDGNLAVDASGLPLSCQSGIWSASASGSPYIDSTTGLPIGGCQGLSIPYDFYAVKEHAGIYYQNVANTGWVEMPWHAGVGWYVSFASGNAAVYAGTPTVFSSNDPASCRGMVLQM